MDSFMSSLESNVVPRRHPFTPAPVRKIKKEKDRKKGLRAGVLKTKKRNTMCEEFTVKACSTAHFSLFKPNVYLAVVDDVPAPDLHPNLESIT